MAALAVVHMEAAAAQHEAVQVVKASFAGGNFILRAHVRSANMGQAVPAYEDTALNFSRPSQHLLQQLLARYQFKAEK